MRNTRLISGLLCGSQIIMPACAEKDIEKPAEKPDITPNSSPNIILIVTDDQPYETIGCWSGKAYTPNIDKLAEEGMRFERAYAASSISAASRYSILTGRYPGRCTGEQFMRKSPMGTMAYIDNVVMTIEPERDNLQKRLKELGYRTGMVGKWHLGYHFNDNNDVERRKQWQDAGLKYYSPTDNPEDPVVKEALEHNHDWYAKKIKESGFDYAENIYWANLKEVHNDKLNYHNIDWTVKGALDFIKTSGNNPFFLYFSTTLHHGPTPNNSIPAKYQCVTSKGIASSPMNVMPERESLKTRVQAKGFSQEKAAALWLDDAVGALLSILEETDKYDNTLIIYLSDHSLSHKSSLYEGGVRTPMIAWWKGHILPGSICKSLVHTCDIFPTIMEAVGMPLNVNDGFDGKSMCPIFYAPEQKIHESLYTEIGNARSVITEEYKYIAINWSKDIQEKIDRGLTDEEYREIGYISNTGLTQLGKQNSNYFDRDQLFNLQEDVNEEYNLAEDGTYSHVLSEMKSRLQDYIDSFEGRPFRTL